MENKTYICIDLKSFYASVEAVERKLDPFKANLVVADPSRGRGAICLAVTPKMKELGVKNRCRIFEIPKTIDYITAVPRMKLYMKYSADIYGIYLKYISSEDIHVYSIDECFFDVTKYLVYYNKTAEELCRMMVDDVFNTTGISASAGIGTNLFLAKIAMDISSKKAKNRIAYLNEELFKKTLWTHRPITDFWNVGRGIAKRLEKFGIYDMKGVANADERVLYKEFGVNARFLIDHSKGIEPCTIAEIKAYTPETNSISNSQILFENYCYDDALLALREMVDLLCFDLCDKGLVTNCISLFIGYSDENEKTTGGSKKLDRYTDSEKMLSEEFTLLFHKYARRDILIRKIGISFGGLTVEQYRTIDFFSDIELEEKERLKRTAMLEIRKKYGKNAILRGMNLLDKATTPMRNKLIGGHNGE